MKYILIILALVLQGCLSTTVAPKIEYRINPNTQSKELQGDGCKDKSLKIAQAFSSNSLLSQNMYYGQGEMRRHIYSASKWSRTPNRAITSEFLKLIRDSKLFKSVQTAKSRSRSDIILEINIEDFMQYFNENSNKSYVNIIVNLSFIKAKGNSVFQSKTFKTTVDVEVLDASGGVNGLNKALAKVLLDTNEWFSEVCK